MVTSIIQDLRVQPLGAKVFIGTGGTLVTPDDDGFYYTRGVPLAITGNGQVGIAAAEDDAIGVSETGIHKNQAPNGLDARHRIAVTSRYTYLLRATAGLNGVTAGDNLELAADGKYITSAGTNPIVAKCWVGNEADGVIEILI